MHRYAFPFRILINIARYANKDDRWGGLIGTNSQSLINAGFGVDDDSDDPDREKQLAVLEVLDTEWDLLVEIQEALRELPGVHLTYIKGHQDDRVSYGRPPLMAQQLKVDADRLAGKNQRKHGTRRPFAFMAPTTAAFLVTDEGTLASWFKKELINRSTGPGLEEYIRTKNGWDHCTFEAVNREVHGKAVRSCDHNRVSYKVLA
jgi:hypothetical protein